MIFSFCSFLELCVPRWLIPSLLQVCVILLLNLQACWQASSPFGASSSGSYSLGLFQQHQRSLVERLFSALLFYQGSLQLFHHVSNGAGVHKILTEDIT